MISLDDAIQQIKKVNPFMGGLLNCEEKLGDYVRKNLTNYYPSNIHVDRQKQYVALIKEKIKTLFPTEDVRVDFKEGMILDTTDHHGILDYPTTIGAHIISRFDTILDRENFGDYYVLDCGNVPFSDALHKRGVKLGGKHLNLYPKSFKNKLVSRQPLYKFNLMDWVQKSEYTFSGEEKFFIEHLQRIIDKIDFSTCKRLSDQIVKINFYLWQEFFHKKIRNNVRRCITLEHDEILINFLSKFLLENKDNIIWKSLFDKEFREVVVKNFEGIYGAWNYSGQDSGTYFFWGFNEHDGKEYKMDLVGDKLVNKQGLIRDIKLTPDDVVVALKEGVIIPSIFTKFSLICFYFGAKILGGPGQTEYTGKMHNVWLNILKDTDYKEYKLVKEVTVLNFNCGDIAFHKENGVLFKEHGLDIASRNTFTEEYLNNLSKVELKYLLYPFIPLSYHRLTLADQREKIDFKEENLYRGFNWV